MENTSCPARVGSLGTIGDSCVVFLLSKNSEFDA